MLHSNFAFPVTNKATRVTDISKSTIDHIITNDISNLIYPCIFLCDLTDHYPVGCLGPHSESQKKQLHLLQGYEEFRCR